MTHQNGYKPRTWILWLAMALGLVVVSAVIVYQYIPANQPAYENITENPSIDVTSVNPQPTTAVKTGEAPIAKIATSRPTEIYFPSSDPKLRLYTKINPMPNNPTTGVPCKKLIDPPQDGKNFAGIFWCSDYSGIGTDRSSLAVLSGHSSNRIATAMNLFNTRYQNNDLESRYIWIKTEASGDRWIGVEIDKAFDVPKSELPMQKAVWGGVNQSTSGRVAIITCLLEPDKPYTTHNLVIMGHVASVR